VIAWVSFACSIALWISPSFWLKGFLSEAFLNDGQTHIQCLSMAGKIQDRYANHMHIISPMETN
jgi:hypothetical protein